MSGARLTVTLSERELELVKRSLQQFHVTAGEHSPSTADEVARLHARLIVEAQRRFSGFDEPSQ